MSALLHPGLGLIDSIDDIWIGSTAAKIAAHILSDFGVTAVMAFLDAGDR
jgi:hypothetical protein